AFLLPLTGFPVAPCVCRPAAHGPVQRQRPGRLAGVRHRKVVRAKWRADLRKRSRQRLRLPGDRQALQKLRTDPRIQAGGQRQQRRLFPLLGGGYQGDRLAGGGGAAQPRHGRHLRIVRPGLAGEDSRRKRKNSQAGSLEQNENPGGGRPRDHLAERQRDGGPARRKNRRRQRLHCPANPRRRRHQSPLAQAVRAGTV
ncbi:MAG: Putative secreted glycosyl hydrolase, partial [uncultured Cytophagales bacterium]